MNISNAINTVSVSGSFSSSAKKTSEKNKWQLTDSLKEKIVELAKKDAKNNVYMGNEFMNLRKAEVAKVAPNRAALIGKFNQLMSSGNMGDMKEIQAVVTTLLKSSLQSADGGKEDGAVQAESAAQEEEEGKNSQTTQN